MHGRRVALLLAFSAFAAAAPRAQQEPTATAQIPLRIIVTDARGRPVNGLSANDVEVFEGQRPQQIHSFARVSESTRKIGILLDEYHVADGASAEHARGSLLQFVERSVRPNDVLFVMKPLDPAANLVPVKSREEVREALRRFAGRKGNYAPLTTFESEYMSVAPPAVTRQRGQVVRAAMQALVTAMHRAEPKGPDVPAALLIVSEGFASEDRGRDRLTSLRMVERAARLANVAVYVLDPSSEIVTPSPFNEQWRLLSARTGGVLTTGGQALPPALERVAADLESHYVATIAPTFKEDGAYHALTVKVKRRDVAVRAPAGYWTPIAAERYVPPSRPAMSTYLKTPHVSGLIQPWFRMAKAPAGRTQVTFSWAPRGTGKRATVVGFSAVTFEGARLHEASVQPQGSQRGSRTVFESAPGPIQIAMTITDAAGTLLDTEVRYIDVPRLDAPGTTITAIEVLRTRTLREFIERQTQPDVMPAETRNFDRHDRLIVRVRAQAGAADGANVSARLLNRSGQPMRDLRVLPSIDGVPQFDLPLAPFARGDYHIEITAGSGSSAVSQLLTFRLVG